MILDQSVFFGVADVHDRHRDMRLDVDNMSYEVKQEVFGHLTFWLIFYIGFIMQCFLLFLELQELLALEERIGNVSTGLSEETILTRLRQRKYSVAARTALEAEPCCICQVTDFVLCVIPSSTSVISLYNVLRACRRNIIMEKMWVRQTVGTIFTPTVLSNG